MTTARRLSRMQRLSITCAAVTTVLAVTAVACADDDGGEAKVSTRAPQTATVSAPATPPATPTVPTTASPRAHTRARHGSLSPNAPLPGMPPIANVHDIYADAGAGMLSPAVKRDPYLIYVPNSGGSTVDVINPHTYQVVRQFTTGLNPQHVVPSYDLKTLYVTNDRANSLTPINPRTGRRGGANIPVADPYNMYFTPNGRYALVVAEAEQHLDFRDPHTFALKHRVSVSCPGVDHIDFSANGGYLVATCEFSGRLVKVNLHTFTVVRYLQLPGGSSPQDIKLDPTGRIFYVADRYRGGVWLVRASTFTPIRFIKTGTDAHGLYPSRNAKDLYVTNRGAGSVTVIDFATRKVVATWHIPGGGSPDMGNTSPDGKVLWLAGRYNSVVYALSTKNGKLLAKIPVGLQPHGLCVWPQPGRYSLGHTGVTR